MGLTLCSSAKHSTLIAPLSTQVYKMGTKQFICRQMLGGNLGWTSVPSRGSRNTPSRFILQKPKISAGTDRPPGLANYDWGSLNL